MKILLNIALTVTVTAALCIVIMAFSEAFKHGFKIINPNENPPKELVSKTDSLKAVVSDLEEKVEILNRYLVQKNLEYIDVCDLKTKP